MHDDIGLTSCSDRHRQISRIGEVANPGPLLDVDPEISLDRPEAGPGPPTQGARALKEPQLQERRQPCQTAQASVDHVWPPLSVTSGSVLHWRGGIVQSRILVCYSAPRLFAGPLVAALVLNKRGESPNSCRNAPLNELTL